MQDMSSIKYMKAVEPSHVQGSNISLCSTTSGSSISTNRSGLESLHDDEPEFHLSRYAGKAHLSVSTNGYSNSQQAFWNPYEKYITFSPQEVILPEAEKLVGGRQERVCPREQPPSPTYNEQAQEEIYLQFHDAAKPLYSEALQEEIYLSEQQNATSKETPQTVSVKGESSKNAQKTRSSPNNVSISPTKKTKNKEKEQGAASFLSSPTFSEKFPVKYTFIHYAENNFLQENPQKLPIFTNRQMSRARSAPVNLMQNNFSEIPFSKDMAKDHLMGNCQPCSYFHNKLDGCRWEVECKFCHLCPANEKKKRRKQRIRAQREKHEKIAAQAEESEISSDKNSSIENISTSD